MIRQRSALTFWQVLVMTASLADRWGVFGRRRSGRVVAGSAWFAEQAGKRGDGFEQQRVGAGLLVGGAAGVEVSDGAAVLGLSGELAYPGGDCGAGEGVWPPGAGRSVTVGGCGAAGPGHWSVPGELGDGFFGAGVVDEVFAGGRGGDEGGGGGVVEGAGQAVGDPVQPGDRVVGEQRLFPPGQR
jgi:hypothetical protein